MRLALVAAPLIAFASVAAWPTGLIHAGEGDIWSIDRENVNVRSGPSTSTDVLMSINPGEKLVEIASKGEWIFADFPSRGERGWVFAPLLTGPVGKAEVTETAASKAAPAPAAESQSAAASPAKAPEPSTPKPSAPKASNSAGNAPASSAPTQPTATNQAKPADQTKEPAPQPRAVAQTAAVATGEEPAAVKSFRDTVAELNDRAVSVAGINLFSDVRSTGGGGVQVLATETWASVPEAGQSSYMNALFDRWQSVANGLGPVSLQIVDPRGNVMMERTGS